MPRIRALAIDFGGTLAQPTPRLKGQTVARVLSGELGLRLPEGFASAFDTAHRHAWQQDRATGVHTPFPRVLAMAAGQCGVTVPVPAGTTDTVFSRVPDGQVNDKVARALCRLHRSGLRCVLACDTQRPETVRRRTLHAAGISAYFHALVLSSELGWRKPHPRFYAAVIEAAGVDPANIVFVGDTPAKDASGPRAHGMEAVLIAPDGRPQDLDPRIGVIHRFAELPAYLEEHYVH